MTYKLHVFKTHVKKLYNEHPRYLLERQASVVQCTECSPSYQHLVHHRVVLLHGVAYISQQLLTT